jgi:hypothetical protein
MLPLLAMLPLGFASAANAQGGPAPGGMPYPTPGDATATTDFEGPPRRRTGIAIGLTQGLGLGAASGYPNNSQDIGTAADYSASGPMVGFGSNLLIMGALADYLNFGFWFGRTQFKSGSWQSSGGGAGLRVELFPLEILYPPLDGLGVFGQFGLGSANLSSSQPGALTASGTQSFAATGVFYEWSVTKIFGGHFGLGPALQYDAIWSLPFERHDLVAALRIVFYGGP